LLLDQSNSSTNLNIGVSFILKRSCFYKNNLGPKLN
jgi:hypothetical protein